MTRLARRGGHRALHDHAERGVLGPRGPGRLAAARHDPEPRRARADAERPDAGAANGRARARSACPRRLPRQCPQAAARGAAPRVGRARVRALARPLVDRLPGQPAPREGPAARPLQPERAEGRQARHRDSVFLVLDRRRSTLPLELRAAAGRQRREHRRPRQPRVLRQRRASSSRRRGRFVSAELFQGQTAFRPKTLGAQGHGRLQPELPARCEEQNLVTSTCARGERAGARTWRSRRPSAS